MFCDENFGYKFYGIKTPVASIPKFEVVNILGSEVNEEVLLCIAWGPDK